MTSKYANAFFSPKIKNEVNTWTILVNRVFVDSSKKKKTFQVSKYTKICSSHFEDGMQVETAPNPILFFKGYDNNAKVGVKTKAPTSRKESPAKEKILKNEPALKTKKSQTEKVQMQEIPADLVPHPLFSFSSSSGEQPTCSTFVDISLLSTETGNVKFDISKTQDSKIAEEPLSVSKTPLH